AEDATKVTVGSADPGAKPVRWRTFGQKPPEGPGLEAGPLGSMTRGAVLDRAPPSLIGWAISSPLLLLGQGKRTITVTLGFLARAFDAGAITEVFKQASSIDQTPFEVQ